MLVTCVKCGKERSDRYMTGMYTKHERMLYEYFTKIDGVYVCATTSTCRKNRKERRANT